MMISPAEKKSSKQTTQGPQQSIKHWFSSKREVSSKQFPLTRYFL